MRTFVIGLTVMLTAAPALACVCMPPRSDEQKREMAARIARDAIAIADVEQVGASGEATAYRVLAVHVGRAPATVQSDNSALTTSCDTIPAVGERTTVVLYPASQAGRIRFGGTCDHLFVNTPGGIDLVRAEAARQGPWSERG